MCTDCNFLIIMCEQFSNLLIDGTIHDRPIWMLKNQARKRN